MVDLMDLLRDVLVCSLQVWMLNDFGKNMFPYKVGPYGKELGCILLRHFVFLLQIIWERRYLILRLSL